VVTREAATPAQARRSRDFLVYAVARPLMLVFWTLILWGTMYGCALLYRSATMGPATAVRQALSAPEAGVGLLNVILALSAVVVWVIVAVAAWQRRSQRTP
jgi:hypothetical protein